ncbi:hypothetical protein [Xanthomonas oryzae]|uniref:hypothetical protein n=1 Tax=Xanthomonas oryzae TaxID=347 RepID=UPI00103583DA|nr:hypothetical protein [Xanthomonas oryzae]QBI15689.1 hypothetical protein EYR03_08585 [Xanthomonas oryzae pv. oryzae]QBI15738.1 hypothetical protein EYR03_08875 [Xanthomonas oryzae pv. oryzae]QBN38980.1 hypothetical protein EBA04_08565 [Xanthomonas oryzae pv. oryzae]QBN49943.1 hypothetical protein EBA07_08535 [Xanthomonas oryzae pv. oryzae]QBN53576.1 hypothetical protein EBA08_08560 [Xanthomonas oryzae pv. oryzae]
MKVEKIDTTTTAGKAKVMGLAAQGRMVVQRTFPNEEWIRQSLPVWNWQVHEYAIVFKEVGPRDVWLEIDSKHAIRNFNLDGTCSKGNVAVRYVREDLAA